VLVRLGRRATLGVTLALVVGSLALAIWATPRMPSASFYLLPTRIWELGIGSLLALGLAPSSAPRWACEAVAAIGLVAIVLAVTLYDAATSFPGLAVIPPVLGAAALIWAGAHGQTRVGRLLSLRPVVFVGLLSYSLYLWHWPIMAFARNRLLSIELPPAWQAGTIVLALAAAWASWRLVEKPFRYKRDGMFGRRQIFALSGVGTTALAAAAAAIIFTGGAERRFTTEQVSRLASRSYDGSEVLACNRLQDPTQLCTLGNPEAPRRWLLWGDSHAAALLPAVSDLARTQGVALEFASEKACAPLPGLVRSDSDLDQRQSCLRFNDRMVGRAISGGYEAIILHARWPLYVEGTRYGPESDEISILARAGATDFASDASGNPALFHAALSAMLRRLTGAGVRVILVAPVPELPWDAGLATKAAVLYGTAMPAEPSKRLVKARQARTVQLLTEVADIPGVTLVPLAENICNNTCPTHDSNTAFYRDNNHLREEGARRLVRPILSEALARLLPLAPAIDLTSHGTPSSY